MEENVEAFVDLSQPPEKLILYLMSCPKISNPQFLNYIKQNLQLIIKNLLIEFEADATLPQMIVEIIYLCDKVDSDDIFWDVEIYHSNLINYICNIIKASQVSEEIVKIFTHKLLFSRNENIKLYVVTLWENMNDKKIENFWIFFIHSCSAYIMESITFFILEKSTSCTVSNKLLNFLDKNITNCLISKFIYQKQLSLTGCNNFCAYVFYKYSAMPQNYVQIFNKICNEWSKFTRHFQAKHEYLNKLLLLYTVYLTDIKLDSTDKEIMASTALDAIMTHIESSLACHQVLGFLAIKYVANKLCVTKFNESDFEIDPVIEKNYKPYLTKLPESTVEYNFKSDDCVQRKITDTMTTKGTQYIFPLDKPVPTSFDLNATCQNFQQLPTLENLLFKLRRVNAESSNQNEPEILESRLQIITDEALLKQKYIPLVELLRDLVQLLTFKPVDLPQHYMELFVTVFHLPIDLENPEKSDINYLDMDKIKILRKHALTLLILYRPAELNKFLACQFFEFPSSTLNFAQKLEILSILKGVVQSFNSRTLLEYHTEIFGPEYLSKVDEYSKQKGLLLNNSYIENLLIEPTRKLALQYKSDSNTFKPSLFSVFFDPWICQYYYFVKHTVKKTLFIEQYDKRIQKLHPTITGGLIHYLAEALIALKNEPDFGVALKVFLEIAISFHPDTRIENSIKFFLIGAYRQLLTTSTLKPVIDLVYPVILKELEVIRIWLKQLIEQENDEEVVLAAAYLYKNI